MHANRLGLISATRPSGGSIQTRGFPPPSRDGFGFSATAYFFIKDESKIDAGAIHSFGSNDFNEIGSSAGEKDPKNEKQFKTTLNIFYTSGASAVIS